jgi:small GTP-binding protein
MPPRKVILVGSSNAGKTTLAIRLSRGVFCENPGSTIGIDFLASTVSVDGTRRELQFWDTAGSERFRNISTAYLRMGDLVLLCYDAASAESYADLAGYWADRVRDLAPEKPRAVVALKADLPPAVDREDAEAWARAAGARFFAASARTAAGCDELLRALAEAAGDAEPAAAVALDARAGAGCC